MKNQKRGLHCSLIGKLPNAYKLRFDVTTFQFDLKIQVKKLKINAIEITKQIKFKKLYFDLDNKNFSSFLNKFVFKFEFILFINHL